MKKYILSIAVVLVTMISCDDRLDTFPSDEVASEEAFRNQGDFTNAIHGAYLRMLQEPYYGGNLQGLDAMSDNLILSREGRLTQQRRHDFDLDQNSGFFHSASAYATIRNVNIILANIDNLEDGAFKNNIKGEAIAIRALAHFDIIKYYGSIPTQNAGANGSIAMPYVTVQDIADFPARDITVGQFYDKVVEELTTAEGLVNASNGVYRIGKNAVNGILSNVYLHMGKMPEAVTAANKVTTQVATRANFTGVWNDSSKDGVIFGLRNDDLTDIGLGVPYSQTAGGIKSEFVPDFAFFSLYASNDIRTTAYFETSDFEGASYNHVLKWYSSVIATSLGNVDAKIIRAAEVQLIKAEALAAQNLDGPALAALDAVRSQRYSGFVSGGEAGPALKNAIQLERRLELAFEGSRFTDLKRQNLDIQRSAFGHLSDGSGVPADVLVLPAGDHRFNLPISLSELNRNPNMVQTPGYN